MSVTDRNNAEKPQQSPETDHDRSVHRGAAVVVLGLVMVSVGVRTLHLAREGTPNFSEVLLILAVLLMVLHSLLNPRKSILRIDTPLKWLGAFLLWAMLSYFWALHPEIVFQEVLTIALKASTYAVIIACTIRRRHLKRWGYLFVLMSIGFLLGYFEGEVRGFTEGAGNWGWQNPIGWWASFLLLFNVHFIMFGKTSLRRWLAGAGLVACIATALLINRRGPLVTIPVVLILYSLLLGKRSRALVVAAIIVVLAVPSLIAYNPDLIGEIGEAIWGLALLAQGHETSINWLRVIQYRAGFEAFMQNPLTGVGFGSQGFWLEEVFGWRYFRPHGIVLRVGSELGIPGLVLYAGFVITALTNGWRTLRGLLKQDARPEASFLATLLCGTAGLLIYTFVQPMLEGLSVYLALSLISAASVILRPVANGEKPSEAAKEPETTDITPSS